MNLDELRPILHGSSPAEGKTGICSVQECGRKVHGRLDLCRSHYEYRRRTGRQPTKPLNYRPNKVCSVVGCGKPHRARGWCGTHYKRWSTTGEVGGHRSLKSSMPLATFKQRFWARVALPNTDGCLLWLSSVDGPGYGRFSLDGKLVGAHRYSYEMLVGPIPEDLTIDHLCRVRNCVNPDHLEPVTFLMNMRRRYSANPDPRPTHCWAGHELTPENRRNFSDGSRRCRACESERKAAD